MHPAFLSSVFSCHPHGAWSHHGRRGHSWGGPAEEMDDDLGGGGFGVRRPLRFLAHKLDLDERQVAELARILDELKTERAQAEVDRRRTVAAFADSLGADAFDAAKAEEGGRLRVQSAERLRDAVLKALRQIHGVLNAEQRARLAYLIRTGTLAV
jgi:Spy/CpxP family protein refolding chaperone